MIVAGSPVQPFVDAVTVALEADSGLMAAIVGVFGHLPEASRTRYPYVVLGRRHRANSGGAMGIAGGPTTVQIDVWSDHNGPSEAQTICSHITRVLERRTLNVSGYLMLGGSLTCEFEDVFDEPDDNSPEKRLYHGVMLWGAEIHESS